MTARLEQIEMLRAKANITYEEARDALNNSSGDIVEALIYLEKQNKTKSSSNEECSSSDWGAKLKKLVKTCNETRLVISKKGNTILNLSLTIVIIAAVFALPAVLIGLLAAMLTLHKIRLERPGAADSKINKTLDSINKTVNSMGNHVADVIRN